MAQDERSDLLDRLARSERLESWPPDDLTAALAVVDGLGADDAGSGVRTLNIRLAIYRRRLQYELDRRAGHGRPPGSLDRH